MTPVLAAKKLSKFDPKTFLSTINGGRKIAAFATSARKLIIGAATLVLFVTLHASADTYYTWDGTHLVEVNDADPGAVHAEHWEVWLFKKNSPTDSSGKTRWGLSEGATASEVMAQLKKDQEFEKRYEKWCECAWGPDTFFNPLGPVASIKTVTPGAVIAGADVLSAISRLKDLADKYKELRDLLLEKETPQDNPFTGVGNVFKEYVENLRDAQGKIRRLDNLIRSSDPVVVGLAQQIDEVKNTLASASDKQAQVQTILNTPNANGVQGAGWMNFKDEVTTLIVTETGSGVSINEHQVDGVTRDATGDFTDITEVSFMKEAGTKYWIVDIIWDVTPYWYNLRYSREQLARDAYTYFRAKTKCKVTDRDGVNETCKVQQ